MNMRELLLQAKRLAGGGSGGDGATVNNQHKVITENGVYKADNGFTGLGTVTVNVPKKLPQVLDKTVTELTAEDLQGVTKIGDNAFYGCTLLASIEIPTSVTSIGNCAFYGTPLLNVVLKSTTPPTIQSNTFQNVHPDCVFTVPYGCGEIYKSATNWSAYASQIVEEEGGGNTGGEETTKPLVLTESGKVVFNVDFYDAQVTLYKDGVDVAFTTTAQNPFDVSDWIAENGAGVYHVDAELWDENYNTIARYTSDPVIFN